MGTISCNKSIFTCCKDFPAFVGAQVVIVHFLFLVPGGFGLVAHGFALSLCVCPLDDANRPFELGPNVSLLLALSVG